MESCFPYHIGILCKHALKVFNANDVFILPPQYILNRWSKYAKRGFYIEKQVTDKETLQTLAARVSRKATSVALKCTTSKELLDELEKAIDKLDLEAELETRRVVAAPSPRAGSVWGTPMMFLWFQLVVLQIHLKVQYQLEFPGW